MAIGVFAALFYVSHKFVRADALILVALVFHRSRIPHHLLAGTALLFVFFALALRRLCLFVVRYRQLRRGPARFRRHGSRIYPLLVTGAAYLVPNFSAFNVNQLYRS